MLLFTFDMDIGIEARAIGEGSMNIEFLLSGMECRAGRYSRFYPKIKVVFFRNQSSYSTPQRSLKLESKKQMIDYRWKPLP